MVELNVIDRQIELGDQERSIPKKMLSIYTRFSETMKLRLDFLYLLNSTLRGNRGWWFMRKKCVCRLQVHQQIQELIRPKCIFWILQTFISALLDPCACEWLLQTVKLCYQQPMELRFQNLEIKSNVPEDFSQQVLRGLFCQQYLCPSWILYDIKYPRNLMQPLSSKLGD